MVSISYKYQNELRLHGLEGEPVVVGKDHKFNLVKISGRLGCSCADFGRIYQFISDWKAIFH